MHHCSPLNVAQLSLNVALLSFECSANGCRVMRNKALNAILEKRSTPLINGTEITLGAFCCLMEEKGDELMGNSSEKRRNIAFNCVKRITLNIKDAEYLESNRGVFSFFT